MTRKFLEEMGLEKEQIDKILDSNSADIGKAKKDLETERDGLKAKLETVESSMKDFEGINVEEMNTKIKTLQKNLEEKEAEYKRQIADREFSDILDKAIVDVKGKNAKAIMALLDIETLKASKNQNDDIVKAVEGIKESDSYLFESDTPLPTFAKALNPSAADKPKMFTSSKDLNAHRLIK